MNEDRYVFKYYKVSINIGLICIYNNSKIYKIAKGPLTVIAGIPYSLVTLLLGFRGFSFLE
jgi:hypothetical protein